MKAIGSIGLYFIFLLFGFPLFYFVYKFGDPEPIAHDFFQYYWLYKDFDIGHVIAPHNMRLLGAFFVNLFYKWNLFYDTSSAFDKYVAWGFLKQVYFDALLFNFLSVTATCVIIFQILKKQFNHTLISFVGACLYLFGFGTIFYELAPLTDAFSVFLFSLILYLYLDKNLNAILFLCLLIFQREYLLIALGTWALMDSIVYRNRYHLTVFISCLLFFLAHILLRKTFFYTPHLDFQASGNYFFSNLFQLNYSLITYFKQLVMTLNLFILYIAVVIYKKAKALSFDRFSFIKILILFFQINLICHVAGHGNNCGRYFYMLTPLVIFMLMQEVFPLLRKDVESGTSTALNRELH